MTPTTDSRGEGQEPASRPARLTVLICTHNRAALLARTLYYLNQCARPANVTVEILVAANACSDGTVSVLERYPVLPDGLSGVDSSIPAAASSGGALPLRVLVEPIPGKSHALNRALGAVDADLIAMVDDDHRVHRGYLKAIADAAAAHPAATLFCGRIIPDWDGSEPAWVHRPNPFPVYPLPVPHYEQGSAERDIGLEGPLPGGGNLVLRKGVFFRVGPFSVELGPRGHNLAGGEDSDFVQRALQVGERLRYCPDIVQHHYVDAKRLTLSYIIRKAYERSRAVTLVRGEQRGSIPKYFFRKLAGHLAGSLFSLYWPERRSHLVRAAATLGEIRGLVVSGRTRGSLS